MKQMKIALALCAALMLIITIPAASAITVDGEKNTDEWNDNWSYGQINGTGYDIYDTGDRLEIKQGAFGQDTNTWYEEDPKNDSGTGHDESMAQLGDSSGYDIKQIYGHYDVANDTLYGMSTVYGIPGDLDGDGSISTDCTNYGDCIGDEGPAGTGMGDLETWKIRISQEGNPDVTLRMQNNNWTVEQGPLDYDDVKAAFSPTEDGVYEISINGVSEIWDVGPCQPDLKVEVYTGGLDDGPGEDTATAFIRQPCPNIMIEKATNGEDADTPTGPFIPVGDEVTWTYNVTNTGDVPLNNIVVTDDQGVVVDCPKTTLNVSESMICTAEGTAETGQYANIGNVTGEFDIIVVTDEDPSHYFGVNSSIDIEKATNGVDADDPTGPYVTAGGDVVWTYNVTNTGNANLTDILVQDNVTGEIDNLVDNGNGDSILEPGEVWMYNATGIATEGQYANIGNVTGTDPTGAEVTDEDPSHYFGVNSSIDIEKATNGEDADDPTGPYVTAGGDVVWTYNVTNTGNVNLSSIDVQDNVTGEIDNLVDNGNGDSILEPGEVWMYNATGTATEGQYANIGNVTGTDPTGAEVTDEDPSHYFGVNSSIDIEKATNGEDADDPTGPYVTAGGDVVWTYNVTNTGNVNLSSIDVQDNVTGEIDNLVDNGNGDSILEPGEVWMYNATGIATEGQYANIGNVTGTDPTGAEVTDEDPSHYFGVNSSIDIEKATNGEDADDPTGPYVTAGGDVVWTYNVTNTGNVNLTGIQVQDDMGVTPAYVSGDTNGDDILQTDEVWMYNATGIATEGQYANIGNVTGTDPTGAEVTDEDPSHYFGVNSSIDIEKATNGEDADDPTGPYVTAGGDVVWTYNVTNTGNVNLSSIDVQDDMGVTPAYVSGDTNGDDILQTDEVWMYNATGIATEGQYANIGNVTGTDPTGAEVTDEDPSHYFGVNSSIDIEKATNGEDADDPTGPYVTAGGDVVWTYNVTNTGNANLTGIQVQDDMSVTPAYVSGDTNGDDILQTDEVWMYNATGIATEGQYANIGNVTGTDPTGAEVTDEDPSHYFGVNSSIDIEKATNGEDADDPTGPYVTAGGDVVWTYNVTNTGNVNLTGIQVQDDMGVTPAYVSGDTNGDDILQTDEVWMYNATGIATEGQYANIGNVTGTDPTGAEVTDEDPSHYFGVNSSIDIEKATNGEDADDPTGPYVTAGGDVVWTYNVTNTGNVNLSSIDVQDDMSVTPAYVSGDTNGDDILQTDEVWMYNATGIATEGQYANIGNVTGTDPTGAEVTDEDPSHYFGVNSSIDIEKATNGEDADDPTGPYVTAGGDVVWTYNVTNTGNVNLSSIDVQDDMGVTPAYVSGDTNGDDILQTDEVWMYNATGIATEGQYANIGNVTGTDPTGAEVTDEDPSHYFGVNSSIDIEKATNGEDADDPTGPYVTAGGDVVWTYNVTNTGNVNLSSIDVQDDMGVTPAYVSGDTNGDDILQTDEVWMYNATGIATEGQYANIGNVTGTDPTGAEVTDEDPSHYFGVNSSIDIEKATNGEDADDPTGPYVTAGGDVVWTYNVTNTGNVNLSSIDVQDDMSVTPAYVSGDTNGDDILQTDEVWMYNATGIATEGQYANIGNVTGTDPTGAEVTDEDPSHYFGVNSSIDIEKATNGEDADDPTGPYVTAGGDVVWTYNVTNTGNVNLSSIDVQDDMGVTPAYVSGDTNGDDILQTDEVWMYNVTGTATEGQYANIGNVTGTDPTGAEVTDEDPSHYFGEEPPRATLGDYVWEDLNRDGIQDETGTGIADVTVNLYTGGEVFVDSTTTNETGYYLFTDLAAGDYFVEFVLPDGYEFSPADQGTDDAVDSDANVATGRTATISLFAGEVDRTWDAGMYLPLSIDIEKSTNGQDADDPKGPKVEVGSTVEWEYVVTNTGSANLTNINVTDDQGVIPVFQSSNLNNDDILEPGETWTYTANGTAEFGQYVNNATATGEYEGETVEDSDPSHYYGEEKDVPTAHPLLTVSLIGMGIVLFLRRKEE
ncbi:DUF7507 domain-containing protein [Methanohalophilus mahii]|uniref:Conserved repeat domain protein n=1 Tax=Methanohalophilus mahii (strain ATCC 35705 / DSM 5219 / SLP) TaxID=547558 RepID=D5E786_METMS|nr:SdrD B-like domain-containing protein [Methanohalophilus mahii]ADE37024.1 conserved repeat domain protein [Methanohalophilus mahii DSM 5219]